MKKWSSIIACILLSFVVGCSSNVSKIKESNVTMTPKSQVYKENFDKVWAATISALAENETIKVGEKSTGIIVTDLRTIDGKELSLISTAFLGSTYKYRYTINIKPQSNNSTNVSANVKLSKQQFFLAKRETSDEEIESYLRKQLFDRIKSFI
jgi:hypothetical protein